MTIKLNLNSAESALIAMLRAGEPMSVMVVVSETCGQVIVDTGVPPFEDFRNHVVGTGMTFAEAWNGRQSIADMATEVAGS